MLLHYTRNLFRFGILKIIFDKLISEKWFRFQLQFNPRWFDINTPEGFHGNCMKKSDNIEKMSFSFFQNSSILTSMK